MKPSKRMLGDKAYDSAELRDELDKRGTKPVIWPAPGSEDTELGVFMGPEVGHGEAEVYARVQA